MTAREIMSPRVLDVILVEDSTADAELITAALTGIGDVRLHVVDREPALRERLAAGGVDIVLSDYGLPGWDAYRVLEVVRESELDVPFILVTGSLGDERAVDCLLRGMDDYVLKSNLSRLPLAIRRAMEKRRAQADKDLAVQSIRKLSHAIDQSPASVIITDTAGRIEYVNRRFTEVTGYEFSEVVGRKPSVIQSGFTPAETYRSLWKTIKNGESWRDEIQNRRKNGELYWDSVAISPLRDEHGTITHYIATQQDITQRLHADRVNREREERFRQLVDNMREVFFVVDAEYKRTHYINPAYEQIWGRSVESAYADPRSFLEAIPEDDRERLVANIGAVQAGETPGEIDFRVVRPAGEVRWVLSSAAPVRDESGRVTQITGIVLDVTERRKAQQALADSESRTRSLLEASFDGIAIVVDGRVIEANDGALRLFGYEREELVGQPVTFFIAPESVVEVERRIAAGSDGTHEFVGLRKDKSRIIVESTTKIHRAGGATERVTALRDVTVARRTEAQIRQAQKMEAIGSLAGGVAHDFNNLLTVITTYASFLDESFEPGDPRRDDLEQISKAASDAAALTRQLLAFSRQQLIEPRVVVLNDVIAASEKMLRRLIGEDISLAARVPKQPISVVVDPGQIEQVILNLAVNARDAMPHGGQLTIELSETELDEEYAKAHLASSNGRYALIAVSDNGVGMDAQTQARVFEPFFTTKPVGKGTGLGLSTVYGVVKQNNGFVWVYSELHHGSTFKVYLPMAPESLVKKDADGRPQTVRGTESILIVEDSDQVRTATRELLQRFGYTVIDAATGSEALDIARDPQRRIDMLITDVIMPQMSGRQVADAFTALRPGTKILYVSGYADDAIVRHGILSQSAAFLQKPFTTDALARKVRELLDS